MASINCRAALRLSGPRSQRSNLAVVAALPQQNGRPATSLPQTTHSRREALIAASVVLPLLMGQPVAAKEPAVVKVDAAKKEGERDVVTLSTGIKLSEVSEGKGDKPKAGDLVMVELKVSLEGGQVLMDTRELGAPLAWQLGTTNKFVTEGLNQVVEGMRGGSVRLAVVPPSLGYGLRDISLPQGSVPPNSDLYYEVDLLRCQQVSSPFPGLACCSDAAFPCIKSVKE